MCRRLFQFLVVYFFDLAPLIYSLVFENNTVRLFFIIKMKTRQCVESVHFEVTSYSQFDAVRAAIDEM